MSRNLLLPVLLAGAIGLPYLISQNSDQANVSVPDGSIQAQQANYSIPAFSASTSYPPNTNSPATQSAFGTPNFSNNPAINTQWGQGQVPAALAGYPSTVVFPGNANSPDLTAAPMEFLPISNLAEIIRFDVNPEWIKQQWPRVSMTPNDGALHGMRVALVTGTSASDLHGSLTYHFDRNQTVQRISFQGWTGDSARLVNLMSERFGFKRKPSDLAGLYLSSSWRKQKGALLMQHPEVIRRDNPTQQVGLVLEINKRDGKSVLSPYVSGLVQAASN